MPKQYQLRLTDGAASFLDKQAAHYKWSAPTCASVMLHTFQRVQQVGKAFQVAEDEDHGKHILANIPCRGREEIEEGEAVEVLAWILEEIQKGLIGSFCPDDIEPEEVPIFFDSPDEYPESGIGSAMMAIDNLHKLPKL